MKRVVARCACCTQLRWRRGRRAGARARSASTIATAFPRSATPISAATVGLPLDAPRHWCRQERASRARARSRCVDSSAPDRNLRRSPLVPVPRAWAPASVRLRICVGELTTKLGVHDLAQRSVDGVLERLRPEDLRRFVRKPRDRHQCSSSSLAGYPIGRCLDIRPSEPCLPRPLRRLPRRGHAAAEVVPERDDGRPGDERVVARDPDPGDRGRDQHAAAPAARAGRRAPSPTSASEDASRTRWRIPLP